MTTATSPAGAKANVRMPEPAGRMRRLVALLAPHAKAARVAGGLVTIIGTYLPWATFVLNAGAYPDKATLQFFVDPLGVTGFRLQLLVFGVAAIALALARVPAHGRILRGVGWGVIAVSVINAVYIAAEGGGLGAITAADGAVAFGAIVGLVGGVLIVVGAVAGGIEPRPEWRWRLNAWAERAVLVVTYLLLLLVVAAVLTSGGQGGAANPYSGAVFLSFLGALAGLFTAVHASGLLTWIGTVSERHRPFSVVVLLVVALALPLTSAGTEYWMTVAANIGVYAATAIGLNIVVGLAGLLDLGYVAFLGIGAFTAANVSGAAAAKFDIHLPFALAMVLSAVIAGLFGAVVGSPTLRVRGDYLAIVTLAFGEIFVRSAQNNIFGLTGGSNAIPGIPPVELFGVPFSAPITIGGLKLPAGVLYYVLIVFIVALVMLVFSHLKYSRLGRAWIAIREDEDAARAMGIRTGPAKILAFLMGATTAGFAGAYFAHKTGTVSYESFRFLESVTLLAAVILGGMGTVPGAVLGASLLFVLPEKLREFADYRLLLFGLALILIMRFRPQGLVPDRHRRAELAHDPVDERPAGGAAATRTGVPA
jgi:branched-chain amino acid transport system permease protein